MVLISGQIYEHAVVLSVKIEDQEAFERDFSQLKPYYTDTWYIFSFFLTLGFVYCIRSIGFVGWTVNGSNLMLCCYYHFGNRY